MSKKDDIKRRLMDPKYLEAIRARFTHLYRDLSEETTDASPRFADRNILAWNRFGLLAKYQFGTNIEIH